MADAVATTLQARAGHGECGGDHAARGPGMGDAAGATQHASRRWGKGERRDERKRKEGTASEKAEG